MPNACAKPVELMGKQQGTHSVRLSTLSVETLSTRYNHSAKALFIPNFFPTFPRMSSTVKTALPPLIEHTFYPVSTAPINNCNQINLKER